MRPVGQSRRPIICFLAHMAHHSHLVLWSYMRPQTTCRPLRSTLNVTPTYTSAYQTSGRRHTLQNYNEQSSLRSRVSNFPLNFNGGFVSVLRFSESHNNKKNSSSTVKHWSLTLVCIVLNFSVIPLRRIQCTSTTEINRLMLFRDTTAVHCKNNKRKMYKYAMSVECIHLQR